MKNAREETQVCKLLFLKHGSNHYDVDLDDCDDVKSPDL